MDVNDVWRAGKVRMLGLEIVSVILWRAKSSSKSFQQEKADCFWSWREVNKLLRFRRIPKSPHVFSSTVFYLPCLVPIETSPEQGKTVKIHHLAHISIFLRCIINNISFISNVFFLIFSLTILLQSSNCFNWEKKVSISWIARLRWKCEA